jgi:hypothetical protein
VGLRGWMLRYPELRCGGELMVLQRLVLDYRTGELVVRCLYRSSLDGPNPGTVRRRREVTDLCRMGLERALASLEGGAEVVGTSGFTQREDVLLATTSPDAAKLVKAELKGA